MLQSLLVAALLSSAPIDNESRYPMSYPKTRYLQMAPEIIEVDLTPAQRRRRDKIERTRERKAEQIFVWSSICERAYCELT